MILLPPAPRGQMVSAGRTNLALRYLWLGDWSERILARTGEMFSETGVRSPLTAQEVEQQRKKNTGRDADEKPQTGRWNPCQHNKHHSDGDD
jgi:hypothetical protein